MKTKEELNALRTEVEKLEREFANLEKEGRKEKADRIDRELVELNEEELKDVAAGLAYSAGTYAYSVFIHSNCGGEIMNVGNPFSSCYCNRCGERHYWHFSFDYTVVPEKQ